MVVHSEADTLIPLAHSTELCDVCKVRLVKVAGEPHKMYATAAHCNARPAAVPPRRRAAIAPQTAPPPQRTAKQRPPAAASRPNLPTTTPLASRWGIAKDGLLQRVVREVVAGQSS